VAVSVLYNLNLVEIDLEYRRERQMKKVELEDELQELLSRNVQIEKELGELSWAMSELTDERRENDGRIEQIKNLIEQFEEDGE
jgi:hypothetical protein